MSEDNKTGNGQFTWFVLGGIAGGILGLLFAPYNGEEFRRRIVSGTDDIVKRAKKKEEEIVGGAKKTADNLILKAIQLASLADKYANGIMDISPERIELEIRSLKAAIRAAVKTYRGKSGVEYESMQFNKVGFDKADNFESIFSDYDNVVLPKREGMKRRFKLKFK